MSPLCANAVVLALSMLAGCAWLPADAGLDRDGDGVVAPEDCWDAVEGPPGSGLTGADIFPGATETWYDGVDQDCGKDDDYDADGDGWAVVGGVGLATFGVPGSGRSHPAEPDCWDAPPGEIDDAHLALNGQPQVGPAEVHPGAAADPPYDGIDQDCDGESDFDADGDGWDTSDATQRDGSVGEDCDDGEPDVSPDAEEIWWDGLDQDCDEEGTPDCDRDRDGFRGDPTVAVDALDTSACAFDDDEAIDCNDEDADVFPTEDAEIFYNGVDDNCDYADVDGDKDGDGRWAADYADRLGANEVDPTTVRPPDDPGDCWDDPDRSVAVASTAAGLEFSVLSGFDALTAAEVYRDAPDRPYDGADQDCRDPDATGDGIDDDFDWDGDGFTVEVFRDRSGARGGDCLDCPGSCFDGSWSGTERQGWCDAFCYVDADGDGRDDSGNPVQDENPAGLDPAQINPGVDREYDVAYDGTDQDCDDWSDWDLDRDGEDHINAAAWGGPAGGTDCHEGADFTTGLSLDDTLAYPNPAGLAPDAINAAAAETWYDGTDQDCDAWPSDYDADQDGADHEAHGGGDCLEGTAADADANPAGLDPADVGPGRADSWYDGTDADCDDNDGDADGDGHYVEGYAFAQHRASPYDTDDCDDTDAAVSPSAAEATGDGIDSDCDGGEICYIDADDDGHRLTSTVSSADADCADPGEALAAEPADDCDDTDAAVNPDVAEVAANGVDDDCDGLEACYVDADDDGYRPDASSTRSSTDLDCVDSGEAQATDPTGDCDDADAGDHPGATEIEGNEDDEDCDGGEICFVDADGDGYRPDSSATVASADADCQDSGEAVSSDPTGDCDDADATVNPGATELCDASDTDEDCDGAADDDDSSADPAGFTTFYADDDGDGFGDPAASVAQCDAPADHVTDGTDCDDTDADAYPGATEVVGNAADEDCDGGEVCYVDADDDGYRPDATSTVVSADADCSDSGEALATAPTTDCDDSDAGDHPGATEVVGNGDDEDCDGAEVCYVDADNDGYRPDATSTVASSDTDCRDNGEAVSTAPTTDCDDSDAGDHPGATEVVGNGDDEDCDGAEVCYVDADNDGYRPDATSTVVSADTDCTDSGEAAASDPTTDCDDSDANDYPGAAETVGNGDDEDCDGAEVCYVDADDDGYRPDATSTVVSADTDCSDSGEALATAPTTDCDDRDASANPGETEAAGNDVDEDCDGSALCYVDADDDGYRPDATSTVTSSDTDCQDSGEALSSDPTTDCDDADAGDYPGAAETVGNGDDEDCDGGEICYVDADNDGYRPDATSTVTSADEDCSDSGEARSTDPTSDCDDTDSGVNPGATEIAGDEADQDCDGAEVCFVDADDDGYRPDATSTVASADTDCSDSGEAVASDPTADCDDGDASVHPGGTEIVGDGTDQDCDGGEVCYYDGDADGYLPPSPTTVTSSDTDCSDANEAAASTPQSDCDDSDASVYPGATEIVGDETDQDCDGGETCYADSDADGDADESGTTVASADADCSDAGEADAAAPRTDCDDDDATVSGTYGSEGGTADGADNDCDDYYDEGGLLAAGDLVITEIHFFPASPLPTHGGEWFELYNAAGVDLTLGSGWTLNDNGAITHTLSGPISIPAGEHVVIAQDGSESGVTAVAEYGSDMQFANDGDFILLTYGDPDAGDITMDFVDYDLASFPGFVEGDAIQLDNTGTGAAPTYPADNADGANWCFATTSYTTNNAGTPGDANDACAP